MFPTRRSSWRDERDDFLALYSQRKIVFDREAGMIRVIKFNPKKDLGTKLLQYGALSVLIGEVGAAVLIGVEACMDKKEEVSSPLRMTSKKILSVTDHNINPAISDGNLLSETAQEHLENGKDALEEAVAYEVAEVGSIFSPRTLNLAKVLKISKKLQKNMT